MLFPSTSHNLQCLLEILLWYNCTFISRVEVGWPKFPSVWMLKLSIHSTLFATYTKNRSLSLWMYPRTTRLSVKYFTETKDISIFSTTIWVTSMAKTAARSSKRGIVWLETGATLDFHSRKPVDVEPSGKNASGKKQELWLSLMHWNKSKVRFLQTCWDLSHSWCVDIF